jgi:hypothetical protein
LISGKNFSQNDPSIEFTFIPDWGNTDLLQEKVHNAGIRDHGYVILLFTTIFKQIIDK